MAQTIIHGLDQARNRQSTKNTATGGEQNLNLDGFDLRSVFFSPILSSRINSLFKASIYLMN